MESPPAEILFETRRHASGNYTSNYPPVRRQPPNDGGGRSFLSYLTPRGIIQIKERWMGNNSIKKSRYAALFISPHANHVAVASMNQITFLHEDSGYQEPIGVFTSGHNGTFTCGTWSEAHDVLGVVDDSNTLYFIKANGQEITRISGQHLKVSVPILDLIFQNDNDSKKPCLCTFTILTSDGLLQDIEISQDLSASFLASHNGVMLKKLFPNNIYCMDYHMKLSLFASVNCDGRLSFSKAEHPGICKLSLWRRGSGSILELMVSIEFDGSYSEEQSYPGRLTFPKVLISPHGTFIATLDVRGCLHTFKFHQESHTLSKLCVEITHHKGTETDVSGRSIGLLNEIVDFTWWSDDVLAAVEQNGTFMLFNISTGAKLLENAPVYSMPLLGEAKELSRNLFLLETKNSGQSRVKLEGKEINNVCLIEQLDCDKLQWNLFSLLERSVSEMFDLLIRNKDFQAALSFADRHKLDKDKVLKSQWLSSGQGVNDINNLLLSIKDQVFVVSQCVNCVGLTEDAMKALLACGLRLTDNFRFSESEEDESSLVWNLRVERLKLLLSRDRLETFLGMNMGRFSAQEYQKFRTSPINEAATVLAESGKIGALNLLFKRHPYSLCSSLLEVLDAIPETVPVQSYAHLLPGSSPPASIATREEDWVECEKMISFANGLSENKDLTRTELLIKKCTGLQWPSPDSLCQWYKNRAINMDLLSGQLDNCKFLIDFACRKGIPELQHFLEDIFYLHQLIYFDDNAEGVDIFLSLSAWEKLPDYEKFKMMLIGIREDNIIQKLHKNAIPFMQKRNRVASINSVNDELMVVQSSLDMTTDSFLVRWLREMSFENKLELCFITIEEGCKEDVFFFKDETEVASCALDCIYLCSSIDKWSTMASILFTLPPLQGIGNENLKMQLKVAEGHIDAGRLLALYQVPKPMKFIREAHKDEKAVKQMLRLILSKFVRKQLGRVDSDWATLWHDLRSLQEKAFPFLDLEFMLIEFCRGLLKAGKFSLARNYLKGTGPLVLASDKAENLVIQAAREYFFSASSLDSPEVWKAKECLNILPNSRNVKVETDMIDAVTVNLPKLGVTILPLQFKQMKDPLEIVKLAITSQAGAYLNVEELINVAKLLGLSSHEDISTVQEAIAREAAVAGDLQLAFDLCLVLAKKGHGPVWDLCAALARSQLENMDVNSRKFLLGFSLSHCDEESIGELLNAWKDLDMKGQCENLMTLSGTEPLDFLEMDNLAISYPLCNTQGSADFGGSGYDLEGQLSGIKDKLSLVAKHFPDNNGNGWEPLLSENGKVLSFAALRLPWLLDLASEEESGKKYTGVRTQAVLTIMSWLARNGFALEDRLIASLAKSIMQSPVTEDEDIIGCSYLLNLIDAFSGVDIIEGFVKERENYDEIASIMNVGMIYGLLHNRGAECGDATQRRMLLLREFQQKHKSVAQDEKDEINMTQTAFWREWKVKLEQHQRAADQTRFLEQIIPGVETARFLSGDTDYIEAVIFSLIESAKFEKKHILKDMLKLADMYGVDHSKVLLRFLSTVLISNVWTVSDIEADLSKYRNELVTSADDVIKLITLSVYPMIDGHDKLRLAFMYDLLSECYLQLEIENPPPDGVRLSHTIKIFGQECGLVSFIGNLNFKSIAGLQDLNWDCFNDEVCSHINEKNVEVLAGMVRNLASIYGDTMPRDILSWKYVYYHHVLNSLTTLKLISSTDSEVHTPSLEDLHCLMTELELTYDVFHKYVKFMEYSDALEIMEQFFSLASNFKIPSDKDMESVLLECLIKLLNVWLKLMMDMEELKSVQRSEKGLCSKCLMTSAEVFLNLILNEEVSQIEGWGTVTCFSKTGLSGDPVAEVSGFCGAMILAGCRFFAVAKVFTEASDYIPSGTLSLYVQDLPRLYLNVLERILADLETDSLEQEQLLSFFSSLCKYEGNLEVLTSVRLAVWNKLGEVSNNLQLSSHIRVYILELMQRISSTGKLVKDSSCEVNDSVGVLPWEGWESRQIISSYRDKASDAEQAETSNKFASTLVALRSSQHLSKISPALEIVAEDLLTIESAVSCFLKVSEAAKSESHIDALVATLREWEDLFSSEVRDSPKVAESPSSWGNDDWDEGWESFGEEQPSKSETEISGALSVHPLYECWMEIFRKLITLSKYREILVLVDKYKGQKMQTLLDEDNARTLIQTIPESDCFAALKIMLSFPYEAQQLQCLESVEAKLKRDHISDEAGQDYELLVLLLSSGILTTIITTPSYGTTFSYICYMIGNLSRQCQESRLPEDLVFLFTRLVLPYSLAELVKSHQDILAGFLVTKLMHTNASLSLVNVAESSLRTYLQNQLQLADNNGDQSSWEKSLNSPEVLVNTISNLRGRLGILIQSALSSLPFTKL